MRVARNREGFFAQAIAGTYVVLLGFDVSAAKRKGLLGFAIRRTDQTEGKQGEWILNKRTFEGHEGTRSFWPSNEAPVQKFRWGDYRAKPDRKYLYEVCAAYGAPGAIELTRPVRLAVRTEDPEHITHPGGTVHQIHFNRSAAASQAYVRRFGARRPDEVPGDAALKWISRGLLQALLAFIDASRLGDSLYVAIYEAQYEPILGALRAAVGRGVRLQLLYDAGSSPSGPFQKNTRALRRAGLMPHAKGRAGLKSYISHHKFIVRVRGTTPQAVWTGSTNLSRNAIYAQLNVGHAIEDEAIARAYLELHQHLWSADPSASAMRLFTVGRYPTVRPTESSTASFIFSPRSQEDAMQYYLELMQEAKSMIVLTTPFGVDRRIEAFLRQSTPEVIKFGLTGSPGPNGGKIRRIDSIDGTFYSTPARIESVLDTWQVEQFGYQSHAYIHTKFLLIDPLGAGPILVTGSANFSKASCLNNDENMLVISGHKAAADVYLTEFLRMFEHYAFRSFVRNSRRTQQSLPLVPNDRWTARYFVAGSKRAHDRKLFARPPAAR